MVNGTIRQTQGPEFNPQYFHGTNISQQLSHNLTHVHYHTCPPHTWEHTHAFTQIKIIVIFIRKQCSFPSMFISESRLLLLLKNNFPIYFLQAVFFFLQERENTYAFSYCPLLNTNDSMIWELFNTRIFFSEKHSGSHSLSTDDCSSLLLKMYHSFKWIWYVQVYSQMCTIRSFQTMQFINLCICVLWLETLV